MPGCARTRRTSAGPNATAAVGNAVTVTRPVGPADERSASAASTMARMRSACSTSRRPASVSSAVRAVRSSSTAPLSRSSAASCWETADGVYPSAAAVADMVPRSANSLSSRSRCVSSISKA